MEMTLTERKRNSRKFFNKWKNKGQENKDDRSYWIDFLSDVMGITDVTDRIEFQKDTIVDNHAKHIDAYIPETNVLIEQKSMGKALDQRYKQSDGSILTPYEQAERYNNGLKHSEKARWIITSNFQEIWIYDMNLEPRDRVPIQVNIRDLSQKLDCFEFLLDNSVEEINDEVEVSKEAGAIVGEIYDAFLKEYGDNPSDDDLKELNKLCVRLVFCLYAEDSELFDSQAFCNYLEKFPVDELNGALKRLFEVLDTMEEDRDRFLSDSLSSFPYVNGQLFRETISIPPITEEIRDLLINKASKQFNWSKISPTIFGAVFESTLNPETRRSGGMHYTSIENIHKVIDPLFLDDLKQEFKKIMSFKQEKTRLEKLRTFQDKLASLKFLDPASGSGNFLTETFISLRKLENQVIREIIAAKIKTSGQLTVGVDEGDDGRYIKVSIQQFYGIEINDFAVAVAKTALWIAESQMIKETENIIYQTIEFFPLKTNAYIHEANALRIDWNDVLPASECSYIMGNPPFRGEAERDKSQSKDMMNIFGEGSKETKLDYVLCWYKKSSDYMKGAVCSKIKAAFVSTSSICQGISVPTFWNRMVGEGINIIFAYKPFTWVSESTNSATVICVIVGFVIGTYVNPKIIYDEDNYVIANHINGYLYDSPDIWITSRVNIAPNGFPKMTKGSEPSDGGNLFFSEKERIDIIKKYPDISQYIRPFVGGDEYLNNTQGFYSRYCLWLYKEKYDVCIRNKELHARFENIRSKRLNSSAERIRRKAQTPYLFSQVRQPNSNYLLFPQHTSNERKYIPIGFMSKDIIIGNACYFIPDATNYLFGLLTSSVHMAWVDLVCGRLGKGYRYSPAIYNNFPWCNPTPEQKEKIEKTAQGILDARELYPDSSLADLYDPLTMPKELLVAHALNDKAVMQAYGFDIKMSESNCVAELMKMYQELTKEE